MDFGWPLLIILLIAATGFLARITEGSWFAPSAFFCALWTSYLCVSLAFASEPQTFAKGYAWILLSCVSVYFGSVLLRGPRRAAPARAKTKPVLAVPRRFAILLCVVGLIEILYLFLVRGFGPTRLFSFDAAAAVSAANRIEYGFGDLEQPVIERCALTLIMLNTFLGGMVFRLALTYFDRALGLLCLLIACYTGALYGSRMGVLFGGSFWLSTYITTHVFEKGWSRRRESWAILRIGAYSTLILLGLSLLSMLMRYHYMGGTQSRLSRLDDSVSFVGAFCIWFTDADLRRDDLLWGFRTFTRFYERLGIQHEPEGMVIVGNTTSNIYTSFRGLIEDFGKLGSCIFLFAFGGASGMAYRGVASGHTQWFCLLCCSYSYTFVSTCFSVFTYNTPTVAMLCFVGYFLWRQHMSNHRRRAARASSIGERATTPVIPLYCGIKSGDV